MKMDCGLFSVRSEITSTHSNINHKAILFDLFNTFHNVQCLSTKLQSPIKILYEFLPAFQSLDSPTLNQMFVQLGIRTLHSDCIKLL